MPSIYSFKPRFQELLRPAVTFLARSGVTANQVTVFTGAISIMLGIALCFRRGRWMLVLPFFLFIRMALNAADGMLAREFGQRSLLGAYLNELSDVIADAFLFLPFAYVATIEPLWIGAVIVLSVLTEMTGVLAQATGASRRYDGPMGKSDRALVFGVAAFWIGMNWPVAPVAFYVLPRILALLLVFTIINRVIRGLAESRRSEQKSAQI